MWVVVGGGGEACLCAVYIGPNYTCRNTQPADSLYRCTRKLYTFSKDKNIRRKLRDRPFSTTDVFRIFSSNLNLFTFSSLLLQTLNVEDNYFSYSSGDEQWCWLKVRRSIKPQAETERGKNAF